MSRDRAPRHLAWRTLPCWMLPALLLGALLSHIGYLWPRGM